MRTLIKMILGLIRGRKRITPPSWEGSPIVKPQAEPEVIPEPIDPGVDQFVPKTNEPIMRSNRRELRNDRQQ